MFILVIFLGNIPYSAYNTPKKAFLIQPCRMYLLFFIAQGSLHLLVIFKALLYYFFNESFQKVFKKAQILCCFRLKFYKKIILKKFWCSFYSNKMSIECFLAEIHSFKILMQTSLIRRNFFKNFFVILI